MPDQADPLRELAQRTASDSGPRMPVPQTARAVEFPPARGRVITISSGKGGVGKTNLSVNLALALRRLGREVILFDADLGLANADVLLGMTPRFNLGHFFQGQKTLQDIVTTGPLGLQVIAAGNGVAELADLTPQDRDRLLSHLSLLEARADFVIVDTGAGISRNVTAFAHSADLALVVTTPEPTARLDAYGLIKVLHKEGFPGSLKVVVNMAASQAEADEAGKLMETLASRFLGAPVEYLGWVPRDLAVSRAVSRQTAFTELFPGSPAARAVTALAARLAGARLPQGGGLRGFMDRLVDAWRERRLK